MSSISLIKCNYKQYQFDDSMFVLTYIFDGEQSTPEECPTPIDVYLNLELAFCNEHPTNEELGWLLEVQAWCENASVGDVYTDDDFTIEKVK